MLSALRTRLPSILLRRSSAIITSTSTRTSYDNIKNYDKTILLEPEDLSYRYDDSRFLQGPSWADEPYIKPTDEEIHELTRIKLEREISCEIYEQVDPNAAPFNAVLEGVDDGGRFTGVERIPDIETRWHWVERLLPSPYLSKPIRTDSTLIPPMPVTPPSLPYFVSRTRSRLYPLYRKYEVVGRDKARYWRNRWDGLFNKYHTDILDNLYEIKWENNEKTITVTEIGKITGDIWAFEADAREYLEGKATLADGERILTSVNEVRGLVQFKGDFVELLYAFLKEKGF